MAKSRPRGARGGDDGFEKPQPVPKKRRGKDVGLSPGVSEAESTQSNTVRIGGVDYTLETIVSRLREEIQEKSSSTQRKVSEALIDDVIGHDQFVVSEKQTVVGGVVREVCKKLGIDVKTFLASCTHVETVQGVGMQDHTESGTKSSVDSESSTVDQAQSSEQTVETQAENHELIRPGAYFQMLYGRKGSEVQKYFFVQRVDGGTIHYIFADDMSGTNIQTMTFAKLQKKNARFVPHDAPEIQKYDTLRQLVSGFTEGVIIEYTVSSDKKKIERYAQIQQWNKDNPSVLRAKKLRPGRGTEPVFIWADIRAMIENGTATIRVLSTDEATPIAAQFVQQETKSSRVQPVDVSVEAAEEVSVSTSDSEVGQPVPETSKAQSKEGVPEEKYSIEKFLNESTIPYMVGRGFSKARVEALFKLKPKQYEDLFHLYARSRDIEQSTFNECVAGYVTYLCVRAKSLNFPPANETKNFSTKSIVDMDPTAIADFVALGKRVRVEGITLRVEDVQFSDPQVVQVAPGDSLPTGGTSEEVVASDSSWDNMPTPPLGSPVVPVDTANAPTTDMPPDDVESGFDDVPIAPQQPEQEKKTWQEYFNEVYSDTLDEYLRYLSSSGLDVFLNSFNLNVVKDGFRSQVLDTVKKMVEERGSCRNTNQMMNVIRSSFSEYLFYKLDPNVSKPHLMFISADDSLSDEVKKAADKLNSLVFSRLVGQEGKDAIYLDDDFSEYVPEVLRIVYNDIEKERKNTSSTSGTASPETPPSPIVDLRPSPLLDGDPFSGPINLPPPPESRPRRSVDGVVDFSIRDLEDYLPAGVLSDLLSKLVNKKISSTDNADESAIREEFVQLFSSSNLLSDEFKQIWETKYAEDIYKIFDTWADQIVSRELSKPYIIEKIQKTWRDYGKTIAATLAVGVGIGGAVGVGMATAGVGGVVGAAMIGGISGGIRSFLLPKIFGGRTKADTQASLSDKMRESFERNVRASIDRVHPDSINAVFTQSLRDVSQKALYPTASTWKKDDLYKRALEFAQATEPETETQINEVLAELYTINSGYRDRTDEIISDSPHLADAAIHVVGDLGVAQSAASKWKTIGLASVTGAGIATAISLFGSFGRVGVGAVLGARAGYGMAESNTSNDQARHFEDQLRQYEDIVNMSQNVYGFDKSLFGDMSLDHLYDSIADINEFKYWSKTSRTQDGARHIHNAAHVREFLHHCVSRLRAMRDTGIFRDRIDLDLRVTRAIESIDLFLVDLMKREFYHDEHAEQTLVLLRQMNEQKKEQVEEILTKMAEKNKKAKWIAAAVGATVGAGVGFLSGELLQSVRGWFNGVENTPPTTSPQGTGSTSEEVRPLPEQVPSQPRTEPTQPRTEPTSPQGQQRGVDASSSTIIETVTLGRGQSMWGTLDRMADATGADGNPLFADRDAFQQWRSEELARLGYQRGPDGRLGHPFTLHPGAEIELRMVDGRPQVEIGDEHVTRHTSLRFRAASPNIEVSPEPPPARIQLMDPVLPIPAEMSDNSELLQQQSDLADRLEERANRVGEISNSDIRRELRAGDDVRFDTNGDGRVSRAEARDAVDTVRAELVSAQSGRDAVAQGVLSGGVIETATAPASVSTQSSVSPDVASPNGISSAVEGIRPQGGDARSTIPESESSSGVSTAEVTSVRRELDAFQPISGSESRVTLDQAPSGSIDVHVAVDESVLALPGEVEGAYHDIFVNEEIPTLPTDGAREIFQTKIREIYVLDQAYEQARGRSGVALSEVQAVRSAVHTSIEDMQNLYSETGLEVARPWAVRYEFDLPVEGPETSLFSSDAQQALEDAYRSGDPRAVELNNALGEASDEESARRIGADIEQWYQSQSR